MTQDEIQELINQATEEHGWGANYFDIPKFANLVAAKVLAQRTWVNLTYEQVAEIYNKHGRPPPVNMFMIIDIENKIQELNT